MELENKINLFLNEFLCFHHKRNNLLFDNLDIFLVLAYLFEDETKEFLENNKHRLNFDLLMTIDFKEKMDLIKSFYKEIEIDFNLDVVINNGVLDVVTTDTNEVVKNRDYKSLLSGVNNYIANFKSIEVYNNGLVTDAVILVHELSHYRNQPNGGRNQINNLLTEALAFTEELIFLDFLEKNGYFYESHILKYMELDNFFKMLEILYPLLNLYLVYDKTGFISKENYEFIFENNENYEDCLEDFIKIIDKNPDEIFERIWYLVASVLSIYMYISYKDDKYYIEKIKKLNNNLNSLDINECLKLIGFDNDDGYLTKDNINKIIESFDKFKLELVGVKEYKR